MYIYLIIYIFIPALYIYIYIYIYMLSLLFSVSQQFNWFPVHNIVKNNLNFLFYIDIIICYLHLNMQEWSASCSSRKEIICRDKVGFFLFVCLFFVFCFFLKLLMHKKNNNWLKNFFLLGNRNIHIVYINFSIWTGFNDYSFVWADLLNIHFLLALRLKNTTLLKCLSIDSLKMMGFLFCFIFLVEQYFLISSIFFLCFRILVGQKFVLFME